MERRCKPIKLNFFDESQTIGQDGKKAMVLTLLSVCCITSWSRGIMRNLPFMQITVQVKIKTKRLWRVMKGISNSITLHCMPVGHTKSMVYSCFGLLSSSLETVYTSQTLQIWYKNICILCDSETGYTYQYRIYTGAQDPATDIQNEIMLSSETMVVWLLQPLLDRGYNLYAVNFYNISTSCQIPYYTQHPPVWSSPC